MEFFLDSADVTLIKKFRSLKLISGVTTNPAIMAKETGSVRNRVLDICELIDGPVSVEVVASSASGMIKQALELKDLNANVVVKLPANRAGFEALSAVASEGVPVNMTVVYTAMQALVSAKLGAKYVSPFVGRLDANSTGGTDLVREIRTIFDNYKFDTKILAASMRNTIYVKEAAMAGADFATIPPEVMWSLMDSELGDLSLAGFMEEWSKIKEHVDLFESN
jgi:transaldolase